MEDNAYITPQDHLQQTSKIVATSRLCVCNKIHTSLQHVKKHMQHHETTNLGSLSSPPLDHQRRIQLAEAMST
jgi:hypothetical protein